MFTNIREEDIRVHCPEYAPMTISMMNKLRPLKINDSVNPLNPYIERRKPPSSINQFVKTSGFQFSRTAEQSKQLREKLVEGVEARDVLSFSDLGVEEEKGDELDELYRKPAPGELSMEEIEDQIEILQLTLTNENLSGEELNVALLTLEYYEKLKEEQGERNERPEELQSRFSTEATPLLTRSQIDMREQEAQEERESRGDAPAGATTVEIAAFSPQYGTTSQYGTTRAVIPPVGVQPLPLPDVPIRSGRLSAAEMREQALKRENEEELRMRLEALQKKSSTLSPIQGPPPLK